MLLVWCVIAMGHTVQNGRRAGEKGPLNRQKSGSWPQRRIGTGFRNGLCQGWGVVSGKNLWAGGKGFAKSGSVRI